MCFTSIPFVFSFVSLLRCFRNLNQRFKCILIRHRRTWEIHCVFSELMKFVDIQAIRPAWRWRSTMRKRIAAIPVWTQKPSAWIPSTCDFYIVRQRHHVALAVAAYLNRTNRLAHQSPVYSLIQHWISDSTDDPPKKKTKEKTIWAAAKIKSIKTKNYQLSIHWCYHRIGQVSAHSVYSEACGRTDKTISWKTN